MGQRKVPRWRVDRQQLRRLRTNVLPAALSLFPIHSQERESQTFEVSPSVSFPCLLPLLICLPRFWVSFPSTLTSWLVCVAISCDMKDRLLHGIFCVAMEFLLWMNVRGRNRGEIEREEKSREKRN